MGAKVGIRLQIDLEHPTIEGEIIDVAGTEIGANGGIDVGHAQAKRLGAGPVHIDIDLWHIGIEGGRCATDWRLPVEIAQQSSGDLCDLLGD